MNIKEIILKHESGESLNEQEINFAVNSFISEKITEEQMADFLRSIVKKDINEEETFYLTKVMLNSGDILNLSDFSNTIDKHSTGGVSDSTSLIVVPLFALLGFTCIKMSGGGLGHTGGTADKMKVFNGFNNALTQEQAFQIAKKTGACFLTSTSAVAPADKKIYALRNKINAMSIGLIASSIMSKKLACGAKNLILDVKYGNGAFLTAKKQALVLAKLMTKIGNQYGVSTNCILGDMRQPLGQCIGDRLEVLEVIQNLKDANMTRLLKHSLQIVAVATHKALGLPKNKVFDKAYELVKSGKVLEKLEEIILSQGGIFNISDINFHSRFVVKSVKSGIISRIETKQLGFLDKELVKNTKNYLGIKICAQLNQKVNKDDVLFECFFETENKEIVAKKLLQTVRIKNEN